MELMESPSPSSQYHYHSCDSDSTDDYEIDVEGLDEDEEAQTTDASGDMEVEPIPYEFDVVDDSITVHEVTICTNQENETESPKNSVDDEENQLCNDEPTSSESCDPQGIPAHPETSAVILDSVDNNLAYCDEDQNQDNEMMEAITIPPSTDDDVVILDDQPDQHAVPINDENVFIHIGDKYYRARGEMLRPRRVLHVTQKPVYIQPIPVECVAQNTPNYTLHPTAQVGFTYPLGSSHPHTIPPAVKRGKRYEKLIEEALHLSGPAPPVGDLNTIVDMVHAKLLKGGETNEANIDSENDFHQESQYPFFDGTELYREVEIEKNPPFKSAFYQQYDKMIELLSSNEKKKNPFWPSYEDDEEEELMKIARDVKESDRRFSNYYVTDISDIY